MSGTFGLFYLDNQIIFIIVYHNHWQTTNRQLQSYKSTYKPQMTENTNKQFSKLLLTLVLLNCFASIFHSFEHEAGIDNAISSFK